MLIFNHFKTDEYWRGKKINSSSTYFRIFEYVFPKDIKFKYSLQDCFFIIIVIILFKLNYNFYFEHLNKKNRSSASRTRARRVP